MGGGALFAAKPGYAQPLGALGLNYSVVLSAWKYHATAPWFEYTEVGGTEWTWGHMHRCFDIGLV